MITVHHLNNSRSQRILWLLEELGLNYDIRHYERDPVTSLAPAELRAIHPLGKSPVISVGDEVIAETGAIVDYIIERFDKQSTWRPAPNSPAYSDYLQFMHAAEGSVILPLLLGLYTSRLGEAAAPLAPKIKEEMTNQLAYIEQHLTMNEWFAGDQISGADIMMSFPLEACKARGFLGSLGSCADFVAKIQKRPAYLRAIDRGGSYVYGPSDLPK